MIQDAPPVFESPASADWWAILGPVSRPIPSGVITTSHDRTAVLDGRYRLGPISLRSGGQLLREFVRSEPLSLAGVTTFESHPIIVEANWSDTLADAEESTPADDSAGTRREQVAARALHRASCLLSLAWGEPWQVRTSATPSAQLPANIPYSWAEPGFDEDTPAPWQEDDLPVSPRELPSWTIRAWDTLARDDALQTALTFWHQGVHLTAEFPSFALVAFAASVEAIVGCQAFRERIDASPDPCSECGNIPRATARFWATVQLVASPQEVDELKREWNVYAGRSKVAHGAQTHGFETVFGRVFLFPSQARPENSGFSLSIDETDPAQRFVLDILPRFTVLTSRLLRQGVGVIPQEGGPLD